MTGRWILHLVRLLALCVAVVVVRPAAAAPAIDRIVLVAEMTPPSAASRQTAEGAASTTMRAASVTGAASAQATARFEGAPAVRPHGASCEPLVLVPKKYLRNCSLLR